ncbi:hypothetical protein ABN028_33190 [Actinopolymorpha sp. B17G11]|uniref:ATP-binding protein n=1 Tax=Actinopolymorpha sp. B17G11 TaxID=3160861 RepID=UPI0032E50E1B
MFAERAAEVMPGFRITERNRRVISEICHRLDGIPLAIELAAVRLRTMSLEELLVGLDARYDWPAIAGDDIARHQTLRSAIDWSFELCTRDEQLMWARASVFPDSFDLESAEAVCAGDGLDPGMVLDLVARLVDQSILIREERSGRAQYRLLDTVRQYGQEQLQQVGESTRFQRRHRDWYLRLVEQREAEWFGPHQERFVTETRAEHSHLRAALNFF